MVTRGDIEKLIGGTYPINFESESFQTPAMGGRGNDTNYPLFDKIPFQQVQKQVSDLVADHNPEWFQSHKEIFEKMTDGMFEMEYDELTFLIRLYEAIGFLGRNLRYSDSPAFYRLRYFIQRYLSDATLDLEFKYLWKVYEHLSGYKPSLIIIDSM
jgi:transcription elongation factor GreA-like protein